MYDKRNCKRNLEYEISYNEFLDIIKNNKVFLIDVRSKQEYMEFHLKNAINIPIYHIERDIKNYNINYNSIIVLYCEYGGRSRTALKRLRKIGYKNVLNLSKGLEYI